MGKISFAIQIYGSLPDNLTSKIQKIILQAARIILGKDAFKLSTSSILSKVGCMSFWQYEHYFTLCLTHDPLSRGEPKSLAHIVGDTGPRVTRSQANGDRILPPWIKSASCLSCR